MAGVIQKIQQIEQVAYTQRQASTLGCVLSFVSQAIFQSLAMVTGTAVAKALFTRLLPFDHTIFSREGFETRRAVVLVVFMTFLVMVFRLLYPQGLPVALGGLVEGPGGSSGGAAASTAASPQAVPIRPILNPAGDRSLARDDLPNNNSRMFHPF